MTLYHSGLIFSSPERSAGISCGFKSFDAFRADQGARTYFYGGNGNIMELSISGIPSKPTDYNGWFPGTNFTQYGIGNATPSTDLAAVAYVSPVNKAFAVRFFWQTMDRAIRIAEFRATLF
jgi:hypothetical protein